MYYLLFHFFVYGFLGWCVEVAFAGVKEGRFVNRGFLNGPICPIYGIGVTVVVFFLNPYKQNLLLLYIASVIMVTLLEWMTGFILEKVFHNKWWDYSELKWNLNGYVCLTFSLIWGVCCVIIVKFLHPVIQDGLTYIPYIVGCIILVGLCVVIFVDLYMTVGAILHMNKHLAAMAEIIKELHRISEELGASIYREVNEVMEKSGELHSEFKDRKDAMQDELAEKFNGLKENYQELKEKSSSVSLRLIKAFPKMESRRYKDALEDFRNYIMKK